MKQQTKNQQIKQAIVSKFNLKPSQVSVANRNGHGASYVRVALTDKAIRYSDLKAVAGQFESVSRCSATGEILSGGNHFVFCSFSKISADLQTLVWALFDAALEQCGQPLNWYSAKFGFLAACERVAKSNEAFEDFKDFNEADFAQLMHDFAQDSVNKYLSCK